MSDHNVLKVKNKIFILYVFLRIAFIIKKKFNAGKFKGESKNQTTIPPEKSNFA